MFHFGEHCMPTMKLTFSAVRRTRAMLLLLLLLLFFAMSRDNRLKQQIFDVKLREEERGMGISIDFLVNDRTR